MFEGLQHFGAALQQQLFIAAVDVGNYFRVVTSIRRRRLHADFQLKSGGSNGRVQKLLQRCSRVFTIQVAVFDQVLRHEIYWPRNRLAIFSP